MNTRISYMYRDADNYKTHHDEVLSGEITQQQLMTIADCLDDNTYFIPHQLGLPEIRFDQVTESDHCWFELYPEQDFSSTNDEPTIDMTVDELVERFQKAKDHWNEENFSNYAAAMLGQVADEEDDGEYFIAVEPVILYSGKTIVGMLSAKIVSVYGEDAMQQKVSSLIKEGYKEDGIHVFFAKDEIK